ncbi:hypothetical protein, partial [Mycolicibacterium hippocampi]|uniref:hypothetical protein n=1 Tax=Mycolicibacterium hippocampi TaxID=659824 RepID=UPI0021F33BCE
MLSTAIAALEGPDGRAPIPVADDAAVAALNQAGRLLNAALRARYERGGGAGAIGLCAQRVAAAARELRAGLPEPNVVEVCRGPLTGLVKLRAEARLMRLMRAAGRTHSMSFGAWVRDGVAAGFGEHQVRAPAPSTFAALVAVRRAVALVVQAEQITATAVEAAEV